MVKLPTRLIDNISKINFKAKRRLTLSVENLQDAYFPKMDAAVSEKTGNHRSRRPQINVRQRTLSSSRAEDIVTAEMKVRQLQPDRPVHAPRDSLLSWSSSFHNYEGLFNWGALLLFLGSLRVCLENLLKYGIRVNPMSWIRFLYGDLEFNANVLQKFPVLYLVGYSTIPVMNTLLLEIFLSRSHLEWNLACILHCFNLITTLIAPVFIINTLDCGIIFSIMCCMSYTIIVLKLVSYIQVNKWCRDKSRRSFRINSQMNGNGDFLWRQRMKSVMNIKEAKKTESSEEEDKTVAVEQSLVKWPDNLTVADISYFLFAPTLCYELNFPRTKRTRKFFLIRRILEVTLGTNLMMALIQQWIVPNVIHTLLPFHGLDWPLTIERLLKLSLPNHIIWLVFFYIYFHSFLNTLGELLNFADRDFYQDWWNSSNLEIFWKNWNLPVHK